MLSCTTSAFTAAHHCVLRATGDRMASDKQTHWEHGIMCRSWGEGNTGDVSMVTEEVGMDL